jgi:hypothetical protein
MSKREEIEAMKDIINRSNTHIMIENNIIESCEKKIIQLQSEIIEEQKIKEPH